MHVLMLDFDGTICVGEAPVEAYVRSMTASDEGLQGTMLAELAEFLADPDADHRLAHAQDAYQAVQALAIRHGIPTERVHAAYRASRREIGADGVAVRAPDGLAALLDRLAGRVHRVLVTNAPHDGITRILRHTGLTGAIDEIVTEAGKPHHTHTVVEDLLTRHGLRADPARLMSVGDVWDNDLAAPWQRGCATAYVDTFGRATGPAHVRASRMEDLLPAIEEWASDPSAFVRRHRAGPTPPSLSHPSPQGVPS